MQIESWLAFCAMALLATATPGPAALLVSVHSVSYGFKKSLMTVLGNVSGLFVMSTFSFLGLSTLVLHSAVGFTLLKLAGALYLAYLGVKLWRSGLAKIEVSRVEESKPAGNLYFQGVLVALTNPKAIVFTTALFPQFLSVSQPLLPQFVILVTSFMALSFICLTTYSSAACKANFMVAKSKANTVAGKIIGSTFIAAGCYLAGSSK